MHSFVPRVQVKRCEIGINWLPGQVEHNGKAEAPICIRLKRIIRAAHIRMDENSAELAESESTTNPTVL